MVNKQATAPVHFDHLLQSNLKRVFNERDDAKREQAMSEFLTKDALMDESFQPVEGRAISMVVARRSNGLLPHQDVQSVRLREEETQF